MIQLICILLVQTPNASVGLIEQRPEAFYYEFDPFLPIYNLVDYRIGGGITTEVDEIIVDSIFSLIETYASPAKRQEFEEQTRRIDSGIFVEADNDPLLNLYTIRHYLGLTDETDQGMLQLNYWLTDLYDSPVYPVLACLVDFTKAEMTYFMRDFRTAEIFFNNYISEYPESPLLNYAKYYYALCLLKNDELGANYFSPNSDMLDSQVVGETIASELQFLMGYYYQNSTEVDKAVDAFKKAFDISTNGQFQLASILKLIELNQEDGTQTELNEVINEVKGISLEGYSSQFTEDLAYYLQGCVNMSNAEYENARSYFQRVVEDFSSGDIPGDAQLVYETAMMIDMLVANRLYDNEDSSSWDVVNNYLNQYPDSIEVDYGGDTRAYLLYNLADALYYSSYDSVGKS